MEEAVTAGSPQHLTVSFASWHPVGRRRGILKRTGSLNAKLAVEDISTGSYGGSTRFGRLCKNLFFVIPYSQARRIPAARASGSTLVCRRCVTIPYGLVCGQWDIKTGLAVLARHPASLQVDQQKLALMFYSCAQEKLDSVFQLFPSSEVDVRAAAVYARTKRVGGGDDFCLVALLEPEEEGSAFQEVLQSTLDRVISTGSDAADAGRQCHAILAEAFRRIRRRGGSRDRALCPYTYERPVDEEFVSYCRVVKKPCYLRIYSMTGFPHCPRYVRKQRRTQLANARRIVRAGIQRILDDADEKRQRPKRRRQEAWIEPVAAILDRLFAVLPVSEETSALSRRIVSEIRRKGVFQGHPRPIVAASIAYLAAKLSGDKVPENDIIELVGCSRTSLRRNYRELHDHLNAGALGRTLPSTNRIHQRRQAVSQAE